MGKVTKKVGRVVDVPEVRPFASPFASLTDEGAEAAADTVDILIEESGAAPSVVKLNRRDPRFLMWYEYLASRKGVRASVFLRADEETGEVRDIVPTYRYTVEAVTEAADGGLEISFLESPAISPLSKSHPDFPQLRQMFVDAAQAKRVLEVTCASVSREIVDAQPAEDDPFQPDLLNGPAILEVEPLLGALPMAALTSDLTISQALAAFDFVAEIPALSIPFKYPTDCCTSRAHLMCRFLRDELNINAGKIWNYGSGFLNNQATIRFVTANHPDGHVRWRYHVAPVVSVPDVPGGSLVLDPSMFTVNPVPVETWLQAQNDPAATQARSDGDVFSLHPDGRQTVGEFLSHTRYQLSGHELAWRDMRVRLFEGLIA